MNDKNKGNCDGQSVIKKRTGAKKLASRRVGTKKAKRRDTVVRGDDATKQEEEGNDDDEDDAEGRLRTFCHGPGDSARVMM